MREQGKIEWKNLQNKENFFIYTKDLREISNSIYKWAQKNAKIGSIETIKWIIEGDDTDKNESNFSFFPVFLRFLLSFLSITLRNRV